MVDLLLQQNLSDAFSTATNTTNEIIASQYNINYMLAQKEAEKAYIINLQSTSAMFPALFLADQAEIDNIASTLHSLNKMLIIANHTIHNLTILANGLNSSANAASMELVLTSDNISVVGVVLELVLGNISSLQGLVEGENDSQLIDSSGLIVNSWDLPASLQQLSTETHLLGQQLYGSFQMINEAIVHADLILYQSQYICK